MCNLYSNKLPHEAMRQIFDVAPARSDLGNLPGLPPIYPKYEAPIVTQTDEGRALVRTEWETVCGRPFIRLVFNRMPHEATRVRRFDLLRPFPAAVMKIVGEGEEMPEKLIPA